MRALSRYHLQHPYVFEAAGSTPKSGTRQRELDSDLFGGNSNWRGPIWMPLNYLIIESLNRLYKFYGDEFRVECPVGSGVKRTLEEVADELRSRVIGIFRRDRNGRRAVFGGYEKFQTDPHFKDYILFHEYFDGDTGRGLGASHQTGWSALVANMIAELHD